MNKCNTTKKMVSTKIKSKVIPCSTPVHYEDSPSRDSDSTICDSECSSPVPFLSTQDGTEGETDVVWNFYTPKSGSTSTARDKNSTPLSRRSKKFFKPKAIEKHIPKRRPTKPLQKQTQLFQELYELNQNLHELMAKKQTVPEKTESGSEEDMFKSQDCSPKCIPRSSSRCLRRNVLSSNFEKPDADVALESDDSMNECLLKASQIVEEKILTNDSLLPKRLRYENCKPSVQSEPSIDLHTTAMDALVKMNYKLDSPIVNNVKCNSPCLNNDSFDMFVGNLNDSALEQLTQMPIKADLTNSKAKDWTVKELIVHDASPLSRSILNRHNSMPESPSLQDFNRPSTSGVAFGRFSSMPFDNADDSTGNSPLKCTPDEIKKKHQLAREKLMAKRLLPFTSQQTKSLPTQSQLTQLSVPKKTFQPKPATSSNIKNTGATNSIDNQKNNNIPKVDGNPKPQFQPNISTSISNIKNNNVFAKDGNVPKTQFQPKTSISTSNIKNNNVFAKDGNVPKRQFQPKTAISTSNIKNTNGVAKDGNVPNTNFQPKALTNNMSVNKVNDSKGNFNSVDLKQLIEKKRQEALLKLRRRQPSNK